MRSERGSAAVELVLVTPALVVLLLFVVFVGRLSHARAEVDSTARDAARAASLARSPGEAVAAAQEAAGEGAVPCREMEVVVDTTDFRAGGTVTTEVACTVALTDLAGLRVPGATTLRSNFAEPVDTYRGLRP